MVEVHFTIGGLAIFVVILIVFLLCLLFYLYPGSNKQTTIPGPESSDVKDGNLSDLERAGSLHEYLRDLHSEYGYVVAFQLQKKLVVSVADFKYFSPRSQIFETPAFLFDHWKPLVGGHSFLYTNGMESFKRRDFLDFSMKSTTKEVHAKYFRKIGQELANKWKKVPTDQHIPLSQHIRGLATKAVCFMMFGSYFTDEKLVIKLHTAWDLCWNEVLASSKNESLKDNKDVKRATEDLQIIFQDAIEHQWKQHKKSSNLSIIDGLLAGSNVKLTDEQMLSDVITLFTMGIQITTAVLTWTMYYLAVNPKPQKKLRDHMKDAISMDVMPGTLVDNTYMKCLIKESIRCGEIFSWAGRQQDMDLSINQHVVEKNTPILEAISVLMKDETLFPEPCLFDPSRFLKHNPDVPDPRTFIPFAFGGSRKNPEESLVYLLTSITVGSILREVELRNAGNDGDFIEPNCESFVTMPNKEETWITVVSSSNGGDVEIVGQIES